MKEQPVVSCKNLTFEYTSYTGFFRKFSHKALNNVTFDVFPGEVFGILGKNGSGKSTLLKILAGVFTHDSGELFVASDQTRSLLSLGLGFQPALSGRDNALISSMLNGYSKKEAQSFLESIKEFSELGIFFEQPVKTYSNGMKSRLGFATAMMTDVDLLLIDEVLSVGDKTFKKKAEEEILKKIHGDSTVIFVSHSEEQVKKICSRGLLLNKGKGVCLGETEEILDALNNGKKDV